MPCGRDERPLSHPSQTLAGTTLKISVRSRLDTRTQIATLAKAMGLAVGGLSGSLARRMMKRLAMTGLLLGLAVSSLRSPMPLEDFQRALIALLAGGAAVPLLPLARPAASREPAPGEPDPAQPVGDPGHCAYWRHCAIDGFLCSCCGGTANSCPPGTEMSPLTWIGSCFNPADKKNYIISYNDCCGKTSCGRCLCNRNEGDRPTYRPQTNNDLNWCLGTKSSIYNCSTAVIIGIES